MRRRILFSNFTLAGGSGTEAFLWDLAGGLLARGWECGIYTPRPGPLAEAFRQRGIPVWHDLDEVTFQPEVLHCQHTMESLALRDRFPGIPALFMVHDGRSRHDTTPGLAGWAALVAVAPHPVADAYHPLGAVGVAGPAQHSSCVAGAATQAATDPCGRPPSRPQRRWLRCACGRCWRPVR